jgi:hypothetical protein
MALRTLSLISAVICLASFGLGATRSAAFPAMAPKPDGLSSVVQVDCSAEKRRQCKFNAENNLCGWGDQKCAREETARCIERCTIRR